MCVGVGETQLSGSMCGGRCMCIFSYVYLIPTFLSGVTHLLSPHNDPIRKLKGLKVLLQQDPPAQLPYLAPVSSHPARRRAAAQTAADTDRGFALFWTLCSWECFREVTALAQNNPMLESWTTFGSALEMKQILMNNGILKIEENWRKVFSWSKCVWVYNMHIH